MTEFVHLRLHSAYSIVDGLVRMPALIERLGALGMPAVALTDQNNLFALVKFYRAAVAGGIKPIVGCDLSVLSDDGQRYPMTVLARDGDGYRNLLELVSDMWRRDRSEDAAGPTIEAERLRARAGGLIALSGGRLGDVGVAALNGQAELAEQRALAWRDAFPDAWYLEVQRLGREGDEAWVQQAVDLARRCDCPLVATNDVRFLTAQDYDAHEAKVCIHQSEMLANPKRRRDYRPEQYLRSAEEMAALFADLPEAVENSVEIAMRCNVTLALDEVKMPKYPLPEGASDESSHLRQEAFAGLAQRQRAGTLHDADATGPPSSAHVERLEHELSVIDRMGFAGYFLIVMEFVRWARDNGVPVGPGRGSGAGSLAAFALGITNLDPLRYGLLFERFLNPERVSMPDFDIDFCIENRDRVIEHVMERYGADQASQIITFGTMAARAVVRDVARVQGKPYSVGDKLARMVPAGPNMTLDSALAQEPALAVHLREDDEAREVWDTAVLLEGLVRNAGKHPGGVVIAPGRLTDFTALYCDESNNVVTQFDMKDDEAVGLVKFDFLGLRTLSVIQWACEMINARLAATGRPPMDIDDIPLDDPDTYALMGRGDTIAVFQLDSSGMRKMLRDMRADRFEDLIAAVALYRPGPMENIPQYLRRKHGEEPVSYPHPSLEEVLRETYGIPVYQEQVMQIAQTMAGYSLGQADLLRRAIGKKIHAEMERQHQLFRDGAVERGASHAQAEQVFALMEKFADYGFNKSHAAAYALVAYQTGWLKAHWPQEFMAALMSFEVNSTDRMDMLINECRNQSIALLAPDVNASATRFTVTESNAVLCGLSAIKGVGVSLAEDIVRGRKEGRYEDWFDFCVRGSPNGLNRLSLEALIQSGACDGLAPGDRAPESRRASLLSMVDDAIQFVRQQHDQSEGGIADIFGDTLSAVRQDLNARQGARINGARPAPLSRRQCLEAEHRALGFYLSGHPADLYQRELKDLKITPLRELPKYLARGQRRSVQWVAGWLLGARRVFGRQQPPMRIATLEDGHRRMEVRIPEQVEAACGSEALQKRSLLVVHGELRSEQGAGTSMRAREVLRLVDMRAARASRLLLRMRAEQIDEALPVQLRQLLGDAGSGPCPLAIEVDAERVMGAIVLGDAWHVQPSDELLERLADAYGPGNIELRYDH